MASSCRECKQTKPERKIRYFPSLFLSALRTIPLHCTAATRSTAFPARLCSARLPRGIHGRGAPPPASPPPLPRRSTCRRRRPWQPEEPGSDVQDRRAARRHRRYEYDLHVQRAARRVHAAGAPAVRGQARPVQQHRRGLARLALPPRHRRLRPRLWSINC